jgi:hypothetical protein
MADSDLDRIDPEGAIIALQDGTEVRVVRLRTRQFFRFLRILTHGGGEALVRAIDFNAPAEEFAQRLAMAVLFSIPDAENEAILFVQSMCRPPDVAAPEVQRLSDDKVKADDAKYGALGVKLANPELEDTVTIIETVIKRETEDIQALGKRLAGLLKLADRTGQLKPEVPTEPPTPAEMAAAAS